MHTWTTSASIWGGGGKHCIQMNKNVNKQQIKILKKNIKKNLRLSMPVSAAPCLRGMIKLKGGMLIG